MFSPDSKPIKSLLDKFAAAVPVEPFVRPRDEGLRSIFLCMTPRSGSTYLGSALKLNKIGKFNEIFRIVGGGLEKITRDVRPANYEDYVSIKMSQSIIRGVFGTKVDWLQFSHLYYFGAFDYLFRDAKFIYLTREDIMAQAVSRYIASATGYYHSVNTELEATKGDEVPFDFEKLGRHLEHLIEMQGAWERFFATEGIAPLRLTYEALEVDPAAVLRQIADFVGARLPEPPILDTDYKRVRNERHERMRVLALAEARRRRLATMPIVHLSATA